MSSLVVGRQVSSKLECVRPPAVLRSKRTVPALALSANVLSVAVAQSRLVDCPVGPKQAYRLSCPAACLDETSVPLPAGSQTTKSVSPPSLAKKTVLATRPYSASFVRFDLCKANSTVRA